MAVDWSHLEDAYGPATEVPGLFDQVGDPPLAGDAWSELMARLCHQGSVSTASFAALSVLADIATGRRPGDHTEALNLAGYIVAGEAQLEQPGFLRARYPQAITELHQRALRCLMTEPFESDGVDYLRALEVLLAFEGVPVWSEVLQAITYDVVCPSCSASLELDFWNLPPGVRHRDPQQRIRRVDVSGQAQGAGRAAAPAQLGPLGARLHRLASDAGQAVAAARLAYLFGRAACPGCGEDFSVSERIEAGFVS